MRTPILVFFIVSLNVTARAQIPVTFYYNNYWELTTRDSAKYIRSCTYDTLNGGFYGNVTDTFVSGKTQMTGSYSATLTKAGGKPQAMDKHGLFTFYYDNGQVESVGEFRVGARFGNWKYFFPNGKPRMELNFVGDAREILFLNDSVTGAPIITNGNGVWEEVYEEYRVKEKVHLKGEIRNNKIHGLWTCWLSNGTKLTEETHKNGKFIKGVVYVNGTQAPLNEPSNNALMLHYKLFVTENFVASKTVDFTTYPFLRKFYRDEFFVANPKYTPPPLSFTAASGEVYTIVEESANPDGGMTNFYRAIAKVMRYPDEARKKRSEGRVFVEFVIQSNGSVSDIKVVKAVSEELDNEAIRAITEAFKLVRWNPARQRNVAVNQRMVLPITFSLGQGR